MQEVLLDEEALLWTPRTHESQFRRIPRIPVAAFTYLDSLAHLENIARNERAKARQVVRDAAEASADAAVAIPAVAAAVSVVAHIYGQKRARPCALPDAPPIVIPNVD